MENNEINSWATGAMMTLTAADGKNYQTFMIDLNPFPSRFVPRHHRKPSRLDIIALELAEQESCPLLTGDMDLRVAAKNEGVEVRGTLWICERLIQEDVLGVSQLEVAYQRMRAAGRRLPWSEVAKQLHHLKKKREKR